MKQLLIIVLVIFSVSAQANDKVVRVLLDENASTVQLQTRYPVRLEVEGGEVLDLNVGRSQITITQKNENWKVLVRTLGKENVHTVRGPKLSIFSRLLNWDSKAVDFPLSLVPNKKNIMVVGTMPMNRYLRGVLPHEMPQSWPLEALKAQAVASRTYALWKITKSKSALYDLKPSVADQVFRLERYGVPGNYHPNVDKALAFTEGTYLVNQKSKLIKAYFHSDCGGDTDSADGVWGDETIPTGSVRDVACAERKSVWKSNWTVDSLKQKVMSTYFLPNDLELVDVIVRNQLKSQRVEFVDLLFTKGIFKRLRGEDLRRLLGYDKIKSTLFGVQKWNNEIVFSGRGNGHGVGMCQWGARAMAANGKTFKNILAHYYPGVKLKAPKDTAPVIDGVDSQSVSAL